MRRRVLTLGATPTATLYLPLMIMNTIFKVLFLRVNYQSQDTKGKEKKIKKVKNQKTIVPVSEGQRSMFTTASRVHQSIIPTG